MEADDINLVALYGPKHDIYGNVRWGEKIDSGIDPRTDLPGYSLYGDVRKPTPAMLQGVDVLVFYIQDVGARFHT
jgi:uncharacterized protein YbbC (DUF1343 family)